MSPAPRSAADVAPGIQIPAAIKASEVGSVATAAISTIDAFPIRQKEDLQALQNLDPVISPFLRYWTRGQPPTAEERKGESEVVLELVRQWRKLRDREGVLYWLIYPPDGGGKVLQLVLPQCLQSEVFCALHDNQGHQGCERTTWLIRQRCYWSHLRQDVERLCRECECCVVTKATQPRVRTFMGNLLVSRPLEIVAIDFTVLERASNGQEHVLIVTDVFSKFTQAYPTPDQRACTVARILTEKWFYIYGVPQRIHSDQGRNFLRENYSEVCASCMELKRAAPLHIIRKETDSASGLTTRCTIFCIPCPQSGRNGGHNICPRSCLHIILQYISPLVIPLMS